MDAGEPKLGVGSADAPKADPSVPVAKAKNTAAATTVPTTAAAPEARTAAAKSANGFIAASTPGSTSYKIGPQDVVEMSVYRVPDLGRTAQVGENGLVGLPLVGEIPAAGKTAQELERELTRLLKAKYLQNPQVTVMVREFNSQRITVEGSVKKAGVFPIRGRMSLLQAISMAEGMDLTADTSVVVFRQGEQGRMAARFDVAEIRAGNVDDPLIVAGDVIVVGTSFWKEQYGTFIKLLPLIGLFALL